MLKRLDPISTPLRSSAIDHELMHCVQQFFDNALDKQANNTLTLMEEIKYEVVASAAGPVSFLMIPFVILLPVVVTLFLLYFLVR